MSAVQVDWTTDSPTIRIPPVFNLAEELLTRNLAAGRGTKHAYTDDDGDCSFAELDRRVTRFAAALQAAGLHQEQRILLCLNDTIDFPVAFLGAIRAGIVPVAVNTLLTAEDYAYMAHDCRAVAVVVSASLQSQFAGVVARSPFLKYAIVSGGSATGRWLSLADLLRDAPDFRPVQTLRDEPCFWLYSSGSTGAPKGTVHIHSSAVETAVLYAQGVLGLQPEDRIFSAAKLFFAYGLGNALSFPLWVGATTRLMAGRPTADAVLQCLDGFAATVFFGVPTLYASLLAREALPALPALRRCISAGEALPPDLWRRWQACTGVDILDGIGSTEMLHIFLSNRPGQVAPGTLGQPVPGYQVRLADENGHPVPDGEVGDLFVRGPTAAKHYWNQRERTRTTFQGYWTHTGDKFLRDANGNFVYSGRSDDMLKVGGIYVSPVEVEAALVSHPAVLEAAVIGVEDAHGLVKPEAFVVLSADHAASVALAGELQRWVKERLAPYKYPRRIEFVAELPKTATGKIQRFRLRERTGLRPR